MTEPVLDFEKILFSCSRTGLPRNTFSCKTYDHGVDLQASEGLSLFKTPGKRKDKGLHLSIHPAFPLRKVGLTGSSIVYSRCGNRKEPVAFHHGQTYISLNVIRPALWCTHHNISSRRSRPPIIGAATCVLTTLLWMLSCREVQDVCCCAVCDRNRNRSRIWAPHGVGVQKKTNTQEFWPCVSSTPSCKTNEHFCLIFGTKSLNGGLSPHGSSCAHHSGDALHASAVAVNEKPIQKPSGWEQGTQDEYLSELQHDTRVNKNHEHLGFSSIHLCCHGCKLFNALGKQ